MWLTGNPTIRHFYPLPPRKKKETRRGKGSIGQIGGNEIGKGRSLNRPRRLLSGAATIYGVPIPGTAKNRSPCYNDTNFVQPLTLTLPTHMTRKMKGADIKLSFRNKNEKAVLMFSRQTKEENAIYSRHGTAVSMADTILCSIDSAHSPIGRTVWFHSVTSIRKWRLKR